MEESLTSPDRDAQERRFIGLPPQAPGIPQKAVRDIAGRRRFADLVRRVGALLYPNPERSNNRVYSEGRDRTYPRTPGEGLLGPKLILNPYITEDIDTPPPPEMADIAGRRRVADLTRRAAKARKEASAQEKEESAQEEMVASPVSDKDVQGRLVGSPQQSSDGSATPPPPRETTDIAGRRRVADLLRRAGTLLDPDPERYNNSDYTQGRYGTYPRTPGEDLLNPKLAEHEKQFYLARAGPSRSQIDLVTPGSPTGRDSNAGASGSGS